MTFEEISSKINSSIGLKQSSPNIWQIVSEATFLNGNSIKVFLEQKGDEWFLVDGKETLKYMNELYELKSADVKMCITNILKIYGFSISGGQLTAPLSNITVVMDKYFDFIMCIGQLTNMFAFFDKP